MIPDAADAAALAGGAVPSSVYELASAAGLRSFAQVLIGPPGAPVGVALAASRRPAALDDAWGRVWLYAASMGVLHHVRQAQVQQVCGLLAVVHGQQGDAMAAISLLLTVSSRAGPLLAYENSLTSSLSF